MLQQTAHLACHRGRREACHIQQREGLLNSLASNGRASGVFESKQHFKGLREVSHHALFSSNSPQLGDVQSAQPFDVEGTAFLVHFVVELGVDLGYLVGFWELPGGRNVVDLLRSTPVDMVLEHLLNVYQHELAASAEAQQVVVVPAVGLVEPRLLNPFSELRQDRLLLSGSVAHKS